MLEREAPLDEPGRALALSVSPPWPPEQRSHRVYCFLHAGTRCKTPPITTHQLDVPVLQAHRKAPGMAPAAPAFFGLEKCADLPRASFEIA